VIERISAQSGIFYAICFVGLGGTEHRLFQGFEVNTVITFGITDP
jgi:hypothetical protein